MKISFIVFGNLPRKSNSRRIFRNKYSGKVICIKSEKALDYTDSFLRQTLGMEKWLYQSSRPPRLTAHIYYKNKQSDLSCELLMDLMQKAGIIYNDRQIFEQVLYKHFDKVNPRCEVTVEEV